MYYNYGFDPFHALINIILIVLLVALVVRLIRGPRFGRGYWGGMGFGGPMGPHGLHKNPGMDILNERYAKGEISKEEYEAKKKDLMSHQ